MKMEKNMHKMFVLTPLIYASWGTYLQNGGSYNISARSLHHLAWGIYLLKLDVMQNSSLGS